MEAKATSRLDMRIPVVSTIRHHCTVYQLIMACGVPSLPIYPVSALLRFFAINANLMREPSSQDFTFTSIPLEKFCDSRERYTQDELLDLNSDKFIRRNIRNLVAVAQFIDVDVMISEFIYPTELEQVEGDSNLIMSPAEQREIIAINQFYRQLADEMAIYYYPLGDDFVIEPRNFWDIIPSTRQWHRKTG